MLYDKQRKGFIKTDELTDCMRSLGVSPTAEEIRSYKKMYEKGNHCYIHDWFNLQTLRATIFRHFFQSIVKPKFYQMSCKSC